MASFFEEITNTLKFKHPKHPKDVYNVVSPSKSKKYGQASVMEAHRKAPLSDDERKFRQKGGIETLAYKTRGITDQSKYQTGKDDYADRDYQGLASDFVSEQSKEDQARLKRDIAREVTSQRNPQMHMGSPSNYKARQHRKMFGSTMLTMPNTVRRKQ